MLFDEQPPLSVSFGRLNFPQVDWRYTAQPRSFGQALIIGIKFDNAGYLAHGNDLPIRLNLLVWLRAVLGVSGSKSVAV